MQIQIDSERLSAELKRLSSFSDAPAPAVTRILWTPSDLSARAYLKTLCDAEGFKWREDALGNTFIRLEGSDSTLSAVATGSHTDAIPFSGRFDGTVGVLGGLEALRAIKNSGVKLRRSLELVLFTAEEPTRFGVGCLGSRAMSGALDATQLEALVDGDGVSLNDARGAAGYTGSLEHLALLEGAYHAFVELHIEQGPILEAEGHKIGLVTAIAAPASLILKLTGEGGHAGAMLMPVRHDALTAAAEIVLEVERAALETGSVDSVATVGRILGHPNNINAVPSSVELGLDIRDIDALRRDGMVAQVLGAAHAICGRRGVALEVQWLNQDPPALSSELVLGAARAACTELGVNPREMVSRAYHDSLFMARLCPMAMIFIPCFKGYSHRPDEFSSSEDIARGVEVLAWTMVNLAQ